jgi:quinolinate synthase
MLWQPPLPERYTKLSEAQLVAAITARKRELGDKLVILGHHYQQDEVIQFADFTGDSFKLSQLAAERVKQAGAKYVIFEGVHFMAESADILTPEDVQVILPDMGAGCSMADMADYEETVDAWEQIHAALEIDRATEGLSDEGKRVAAGISRSSGPSVASPLRRSVASSVRVIPICYMNSSAAIKSFFGEHGGAVCTSSNCDKVFKWALAGGDRPLAEGESVKILFTPDQHLGRNTAAAMGYDLDAVMDVWDPKPADGMGGLPGGEEDIRRATFILWKGHCSVHKLFRPEHVDQARAEWPDVTVIVHPECQHDVVEKADLSGSTEGIIKAIETAAPGSYWAIGTEVHLVTRLAREAAKRGVHVKMLSGCQCLCTTMYRIDMPHLLWVMDNLVRGKVVNQIKVHPQVRHWATVALDRMLKITADANRAVVERVRVAETV